jgi:hypothetical protein
MPVALSECFQAANGTAHHLCKAKDWNVVLRVGSHLDIPLGNAFTTCSGYERDGLIYHASDGDIKVVRGKVSTFDKEQGSPMGTQNQWKWRQGCTSAKKLRPRRKSTKQQKV